MTFIRASFALVPLFIAGCDCGGGSEQEGVPPGEGEHPDDGYSLEFVTGPSIALDAGEDGELTARYIGPDGQPADGSIWFDVDGEQRGTTLDGAGGETDYDGKVTVTVRAGSIETEFDVVASADYADPITFHVSVGGAPSGGGSLRVELTYGGSRRLHGADIYLYEGEDCEDLDPLAPPAADELGAVQSIRDDAVFEHLAVGSRYAVLAVGFNDEGNAAAWSCWPEAVVEDEGETDVELPLQDLPMTLDGRWELENHFDVGEALPDNLDALFDALDQMSDDPNDPATFILDEMRNQIDDDVLRIAFDAARAYWNLDEQLNEMILSVAPDFVVDAVGAGGDLGRALSSLRIDSDLRLNKDEEFETIYADHELIDLVLSLDGVTNRFNIAEEMAVADTTAEDVEVTLVDERALQIGQHQFQVGLGTLVLFALNNIVLPRFQGSPDSLAEMLTTAVHCGDVGDLLADDVASGSSSAWEDICGFALAAVSLWAEQQIVGMNDDYDTLTLEGEADIKDSDGDLGFDVLQDGEWTSTWSGPAGSVQFPGEFEGERY